MIPPIKAVRGLIIGEDGCSPESVGRLVAGSNSFPLMLGKDHYTATTAENNCESFNFHMGPALDVPAAYRMIRTGFSSGSISHTCRFL